MKQSRRPRSLQGDDRDYVLTYWSEKLGVPRMELRAAVIKEGTIGKAIRKYQAFTSRGAGQMVKDTRQLRR